MSDAPRMSRRQLREQGKLSVRPADGIDISETTELRLRRPSRKDLREARKAETGMIPAVTQPVVEGEAPAKSQESAQPERLSVFERFEEANTPEPVQDDVKDRPEEATGEHGISDDAVESHDEQPVDEQDSHVIEDGDAQEQPTQDSDSHEERDEAESTSTDSENHDDDDGDEEETPMAMRERLLSMTRRQSHEEPVQETTGDVSRTSVMPEGSDLEAEELGQLVAPSASQPEDKDVSVVVNQATSEDDMSYYEDDEDDNLNPRRTILNYILLVLIAVLVGVLFGLGINKFFFNASGTIDSTPVVSQELLL